MTRRICIYGGSFNPPHVCHVLASTWAVSTLPIDELWWIPTYAHAFGKDLESFEDRFALCAAALDGLGDRFFVCRIEEELGGTSRTIDTLRALDERHPDTRWSMLIGADILQDTPRWKAWDEITAMCEIFVVGREGHDGGGHDMPLVLPDVSSTDIRQALADGDKSWLRARVPSAVLQLIRERKLYS